MMMMIMMIIVMMIIIIIIFTLYQRELFKKIPRLGTLVQPVNEGLKDSLGS